MQFTKSLLVLALPLLAVASPTPSNTALDARGITVDYAAVQALRQTLYDAYGQTNDISNNVVAASNNLLNRFSGSAADSFREGLKKYRENQEEASRELLALAETVGGVAESFEDADGTASKEFSSLDSTASKESSSDSNASKEQGGA